MNHLIRYENFTSLTEKLLGRQLKQGIVILQLAVMMVLPIVCLQALAIFLFAMAVICDRIMLSFDHCCCC